MKREEGKRCDVSDVSTFGCFRFGRLRTGSIATTAAGQCCSLGPSQVFMVKDVGAGVRVEQVVKGTRTNIVATFAEKGDSAVRLLCLFFVFLRNFTC